METKLYAFDLIDDSDDESINITFVVNRPISDIEMMGVRNIIKEYNHENNNIDRGGLVGYDELFHRISQYLIENGFIEYDLSYDHGPIYIADMY